MYCDGIGAKLKAGNIIETIDGSEFKVISASGFNLKGDEGKAEFILYDLKNDSMEGYFETLEEIEEDYYIYKNKEETK